MFFLSLFHYVSHVLGERSRDQEMVLLKHAAGWRGLAGGALL